MTPPHPIKNKHIKISSTTIESTEASENEQNKNPRTQKRPCRRTPLRRHRPDHTRHTLHRRPADRQTHPPHINTLPAILPTPPENTHLTAILHLLPPFSKIIP